MPSLWSTASSIENSQVFPFVDNTSNHSMNMIEESDRGRQDHMRFDACMHGEEVE